MSVFIFECDQTSYRDCVTRNIFGSGGQWALDVRKGDQCYLYNLTNRTIYGTWQAVSNAVADPNPDLWEGRFPNRVSVILVSEEIQDTPKSSISDIVVNPDNRRVRNVLSAEQAQALFAHFNLATEDSNVALLQPEIEDYRRKYPAVYRCTDGHYVRSLSEMHIDNWLADNRIFHAYEPVVRVAEAEQFIPDFKVYNQDDKPIYIEFWGLEEDNVYKRKMDWKLRMYANYNFTRVDIRKNDLANNLELCMYQKLRNHSVIP